MKIGCLAVVGLFLGGLIGGVLGIGAGLIWTSVFHTTGFEGYSGMLVFESFMPAGILLGALAGGAGLGYLASRDTAS